MFMIDLGVQSHYSALGIAPDAGAKQIRASASKIAGDFERQRQRARTPEEKRRHEERVLRINKISEVLCNPERREEYDRKNAHLTFFLIRKTAAVALEERGARLRWVHQAVREFLLAKGEQIDPLTDLERSDFTADSTPNHLLETLLKRRQD